MATPRLGPGRGRRSGSGPQFGQSRLVQGGSAQCPLRARPLPLEAEVQGLPLPDTGEVEWAQQGGHPPRLPTWAAGRPGTLGELQAMNRSVGDPWAHLRVPTSLLPLRIRPDLGSGCGCWEEPTACRAQCPQWAGTMSLGARLPAGQADGAGGKGKGDNPAKLGTSSPGLRLRAGSAQRPPQAWLHVPRQEGGSLP